MGAPNVKQKLTITGGGAPTISGIQDALGTLRQLGAPAEGGKLTLQQNINGWAIFIEWVPEPEAKAKGGDVHVHPGGIVINPAAGITEEDALKVVPRRIRDNPQA